jgi:hypothetical protein
MLIESDKEKSRQHDRNVSLLDTAELGDKISGAKEILTKAIEYIQERQKHLESSKGRSGLFNSSQDDNVSGFIEEAKEVVRSAGACATYIKEMKKDPGHPGS